MGFLKNFIMTRIAIHYSKKLPEMAFKDNFQGATEIEVSVKKNKENVYEIANRESLKHKLTWFYWNYIQPDKSKSHAFMLLIKNQEHNTLNVSFIRKKDSVLMRGVNICGTDLCSLLNLEEKNLDSRLEGFLNEIESNLGKLQMKLFFIDSPSRIRNFSNYIPYCISQQLFLSYYESIPRLIEIGQSYIPNSDASINNMNKRGTVI